MIILGYAGSNTTLRDDHILTTRTCRQSTAESKGIPYLESLFLKNLEDLYKILEWNVKNKIKFYRISSNMAPHITNPKFLKDDKYSDLAYRPEKFRKILKKIGNYAKSNKMRLTFHPDLFNVLNSPNQNVVLKTTRDLYFHIRLIDLMGLDYNSVVILHGGGIYGEKEKSMKRWIKNFNKLPIKIKRRVVLENDETSYSIKDVMIMSNSVKPFSLGSLKVKIPVVFDIFHYYCYNLTLLRLGSSERQASISEILPVVHKTWVGRVMKMHLSQQLPGAVFGAHDDFVDKIPEELITYSKEKKVGDLYLMIEAKTKEKALELLRKRYSDVS